MREGPPQIELLPHDEEDERRIAREQEATREAGVAEKIVGDIRELVARG